VRTTPFDQYFLGIEVRTTPFEQYFLDIGLFEDFKKVRWTRVEKSKSALDSR
jgi:hypothetical protein